MRTSNDNIFDKDRADEVLSHRLCTLFFHHFPAVHYCKAFILISCSLIKLTTNSNIHSVSKSLVKSKLNGNDTSILNSNDTISISASTSGNSNIILVRI